MAQSATHSENGVNSGVLLSEEYENVPLKQRLKMLMAAHSISFNSVVKLESEIPELTPNTIGSVARKRGNKHSNSQMIETVMRQEKHAVKVEEGVDSQATKCSYSYSLPGIQQVNFGPETSDQFRDELDQVVLKERLSKSLELQSTLEKNSSGISVSASEPRNKQSAGRVGLLSSC
ncbi:uncharacterized protein LOC142536825 isoform X3 [Primulina tabacum]|uniref:uncharacterized protein LOC142536825 isoform X3 n=1 Tax=Primulina tabacum TaxID=48773 RepID=UPI003F591972